MANQNQGRVEESIAAYRG